MRQLKEVVETGSSDGPRADSPGEKPCLSLFQGMGNDDPELVELGVACKKWVQTVQISYPPWRVLLHSSDFSFEALVSDIMMQIAMRSPTGPILLAGYSWGGNIAFVVAAHLQKTGRAVRFLGLLDSEARPGIDYATDAPRPLKTHWQQFMRFTAAVRRGNSVEKLTYKTAEQLIRPRFKPLLKFYARVPRNWLLGNFAIHLERDLQSFHFRPLQHQWAILRKVLPPLQAPVFLFRTAKHEQHATNSPHHLEWGHCCLNLTVLSTPGAHHGEHGMLGPSNLPILCAAFKKVVLQATIYTLDDACARALAEPGQERQP